MCMIVFNSLIIDETFDLEKHSFRLKCDKVRPFLYLSFLINILIYLFYFIFSMF